MRSHPRAANTTAVAHEPTPLHRLSGPVVGVLALIFSEATFFGALIVTYLLYRHRSPSGPGPDVLEVSRTALFSLALFASSATIAIAGRRLRRDDQRGFRVWLLATILLGGIFLFGQVTDYQRMYAANITIGRNLFTSAFFALTGFHGMHVAIGVLALAVLAGLAFAREFRPDKRTAVEAVTLYWHFADVVWVVIFSIV